MAKTEKQNTPLEKERTTLYLEAGILKKIRLIAAIEDVNQTDILGNALTEFIDRWEKKNGALPQKA